MPCDAIPAPRPHQACNFVPSKNQQQQQQQQVSNRTMHHSAGSSCKHCEPAARCPPQTQASLQLGCGRACAGSGKGHLASASNQCSIRSSASAVSILSSKSLNTDLLMGAGAGNAVSKHPTCCACCARCSCSYSIKSSKCSQACAASTRELHESGGGGGGDSIKIVIVSGNGASGGGCAASALSSAGSGSAARSANKLPAQCLYSLRAPSTGKQAASARGNNSNDSSHELDRHRQHYQTPAAVAASAASSAPPRTQHLSPSPRSQREATSAGRQANQSRASTISDINMQLPPCRKQLSHAAPSSSAKCVVPPPACACGHLAKTAGHALSSSSASSSSPPPPPPPPSSTTNQNTGGNSATCKQQQHPQPSGCLVQLVSNRQLSMRERADSKVSTCSSASSASSATPSRHPRPAPRCRCTSPVASSVRSSRASQQPSWPPPKPLPASARSSRDDGCQQCRRERSELAESDDEVRDLARVSGESRARQKLSALFEGPAQVKPEARPASRCSVGSVSTAGSASVVSSSSSAASTSDSSHISFGSSNVALSAYTTSSISMVVTGTASKRPGAVGGSRNESLASGGGHEPTTGQNKTSELMSADENNNNNESDFPNAYASLADLKAATPPQPPSPPPPPPPPPPMPIGLNDHLLANRAGGTATGADSDPTGDLLRLAVAKRLSLQSQTESSDSKSSVGSASSHQSRRPPSISAMAAFIPPQFSAPPKDGANIKPSEYLKRVNSSSTLATSASSSSGVSSKTSTPVGSLSSSTGASLISRTSLATSASGSASESARQQGQDAEVAPGPLGGGVKSLVARAGAFEARQVIQANNRFRQLKQRRPFFELNRSQSTSALNKLEDEQEDADEAGACSDAEDEDKDEDEAREEDDDEQGQDENDLDDGISSSSASGASGERDKSQRSEATSSAASSSDRPTSDDIAGNLMNELRSFDKSKLARMMTKRPDAFDDNNRPGTSDKLDHLLAATKRDLIAELKESKDLDGIKRMRESTKGKQEIKQVLATAMPVFKPEDFLDKIAESEPGLPLWRRQMLAKKAADRARKEHEERLKQALEEKRLSQVPQWKRQMMARKAAERSKMEKSKKDNEQRQLSEMPTWRRQLARIKITASTGSINTIAHN